jgi:hypothetical protein
MLPDDASRKLGSSSDSLNIEAGEAFFEIALA